MVAHLSPSSVASLSLAKLPRLLASYRPAKKWYRRYFCRRSSVAIILRKGSAGPEVLMIERAEREGDPWSGHMAFPGGHRDADDSHGMAAACRETEEEVGLAVGSYGDCQARLSDISTGWLRGRGRRPMVISCYLFVADDELPAFTLNHEVADTLWIPLSFLAAAENRQSMQWRPGGRGPAIELPCYIYEQRRIWGLSLIMLDELMALLTIQAA